MKMKKGSLALGLVLHLCTCLAPRVAFATPRPPVPPWPESPLQQWDFDAPYEAALRGTVVPTDLSNLAEGWSGFALQRDGLSTAPIILPAMENSHTNIAGTQGSIRFWFSPAWSSEGLGGKGPDHYARLLELVVADGNTGGVAWSLYASPDGGTLFLSGISGQDAVDLLKADVQLESGRWYLVTLNYSANTTALFLNTQLIAEGAGVPGVNPALAGLVVGSDWTGGNLAGGLFDEVTTFGSPLSQEHSNRLLAHPRAE